MFGCIIIHACGLSWHFRPHAAARKDLCWLGFYCNLCVFGLDCGAQKYRRLKQLLLTTAKAALIAA